MGFEYGESCALLGQMCTQAFGTAQVPRGRRPVGRLQHLAAPGSEREGHPHQHNQHAQQLRNIKATKSSSYGLRAYKTRLSEKSAYSPWVALHHLHNLYFYQVILVVVQLGWVD